MSQTGASAEEQGQSTAWSQMPTLHWRQANVLEEVPGLLLFKIPSNCTLCTIRRP